MKALTYRQLFDYWMGHRRITIHMHDKTGHHSAFAISMPHSNEYIDEIQHAIDRAEVFQIGCGEPMVREVFIDFLKKGQGRSTAESGAVRSVRQTVEV